jgi:hypothetical protein
MRRPRAVLLATITAVLSGFALAGAGSATPPPGSDYRWAQPGCAPVTTRYAQPPASVPAVPAMPAPGADYRWMQPGCAPVTTAHAQPPASVPIG